MQTYEEWFSQLTGFMPHQWQKNLGNHENCLNRLIRVPTGMGKTLGILSAWGYHRIEKNSDTWPLRLVWCLPMRVLVEQTYEEAHAILKRLNLLWNSGSEDHTDRIGLHLLMGGSDDERWRYYPEYPAIFIGTQDMLLSRALNRGYASPRGRWPMEYALLNTDALWVMDEVQLMDVGLATSVQLQAFREQELEKALRPCISWWMSATLQSKWLDTADFRKYLPALENSALQVATEDRHGGLWDVKKTCRIEQVPQTDKDKKMDVSLGEIVADVHSGTKAGPHGHITLSIVNTVDRALALYEALKKIYEKHADPPELFLMHSRFRGLERRQWVERFLHKRYCTPECDRIIISTQVIEAGVDISATGLVTELAPWPSLVQRFGRAARYGDTAAIVVADRKLKEKKCLPYNYFELQESARALEKLNDVSISSLERFEEGCGKDFLAGLYPYEPLHLLTRRECDELFDTGVDLTGSDLDISRFIRTGEERDLLVFWAQWEGDVPPVDLRARRDALCPVPVKSAKDWMKRLKGQGWTWDYLDNRWRSVEIERLRPGLILLVRAEAGGYHPERGFTGKKPNKKDKLPDWKGGIMEIFSPDEADAGQDREDQSIQGWKTIATHGMETDAEVRRIAGNIGLDNSLSRILGRAARFHDWGKAHIAFQSNIQESSHNDLAKAPDAAWKHWNALYRHETCGTRRGFRHELVSACALLELLALNDHFHAALLGPFREFIDAGILPDPEESHDSGGVLAAELASLDACTFNLLAYMVCSHHGKIRATWQSTPHDQDFRDSEKIMGTGQPLRGVREADTLPPCRIAADNGTICVTPRITIHLDAAEMGLSGRYGQSWNERCLDLLEKYGPFTLAFLETLLRVADARASAADTDDPLLHSEGGNS